MSGADTKLVIAFDARIGNMERALERVSKSLEKVQADSKKTTDAVKNMENAFAAASGKISAAFNMVRNAAVIALLVQGITTAIEKMSELADAADALGMSTEALQTVQAAFAQSGGNAGQVEQTVGRLAAMIGEANNEGEQAQKTFERFGISFRNLDGSARTAEQALDDIYEKIRDASSATEALNIATAFFGQRGARAAVNAANQMGASIAETRAEYEAMGLVLSQETVHRVREIGDAWDVLVLAMTNAWARLAALLAPIIIPVLNFIRELITTLIGWIETVVGAAETGLRRLGILAPTPVMAAESAFDASQRRFGQLLQQRGNILEEWRQLEAQGRLMPEFQPERDATLQRLDAEVAAAMRARDAAQAARDQARRDATLPGPGAVPTGQAAPPVVTAGSGGTDTAAREMEKRLREAQRILERIVDQAETPLEAMNTSFRRVSDAIKLYRDNLARLDPEQRRALEAVTFETFARNAEEASKTAAAALLRLGYTADQIVQAVTESVRRAGEQLGLSGEQLDAFVQRGVDAANRVVRPNQTFGEGIRAGAGIKPGQPEDTFEFALGQGIAQEGMKFFDDLLKTLNDVAAGTAKAGEAFLKLGLDFAKAIAMMIAKEAALRAIRAAFNYFFPSPAPTGGGITPGGNAFGGFRAGGGPVSAGMSYIVGERGPEWFTPSAAGAITPMGGGANLVINNNAPGVIVSQEEIDGRTVVAAVNLARSEISRDYTRSMRTGFGPYSETMTRAYNVPRRF